MICFISFAGCKFSTLEICATSNVDLSGSGTGTKYLTGIGLGCSISSILAILTGSGSKTFTGGDWIGRSSNLSFFVGPIKGFDL